MGDVFNGPKMVRQKGKAKENKPFAKTFLLGKVQEE